MTERSILSERRLAEWAGSGVLVLRGALDVAGVRRLDEAVCEVARWAETGGPGLHHYELTDAGPVLARSEDFTPHQPVLAEFLRSPAVFGVLAELFGEPPVLFKEKVNYKLAGGAGFAPHQDATAYRFGAFHISLMVALDPATEASGCLWFASGRQAEVLPNQSGRIDVAWVDAAHWYPVAVEPGDLVFFDSYAPHYSDTNRTAASRRALYVTYNAASAGDLRDRYYVDKRAALATVVDEADTGRVRMSINDDFLGRWVPSPSAR
jgi:hypothetical protein